MPNARSRKASRIASTGSRTAAGSRPSLAELHAMGKSLREKCPRSAHAVWKAPRGRPDPLRLLEQSNQGRLPELIPIRYGRMVRTPFTFYRGAALNMAADLAVTPATGLRVQACGDCHLLNFGDFATPERRVIFDINDLDETLPAPWEWDVKRLAASFVLACRNNGFSTGLRPRCRAVLRALVSRTHGGIQPDAGAGRVVCEHRRRKSAPDASRTRRPASGTRSGWPRPALAACWSTTFPSSRPWPVDRRPSRTTRP